MDSWGGGSLHLHYLTAQVPAFPVGFSSSLQNEGLHAAGQQVFILYVCVQAAWPPSGSVWLGKTGGIPDLIITQA